MDAFDCIATKLDVREYSSRPVPREVKLKVLEAARLTSSGVNSQHWRFILVQSKDLIAQLAADSTSGDWISGADFAVIVLTDPRHPYHKLDAGRAVQDMQLAAWNEGVVSCIFTGLKQDEIRAHFAIPGSLEVSVVAGFGYPARRITGTRKRRAPLERLAFIDRFGGAFEADALSG